LDNWLSNFILDTATKKEVAFPNYVAMNQLFVVEGLPGHLTVQKPQRYTVADLRSIITSQLSIRFVLLVILLMMLSC
jgi:hypothetical protein